MSHLKSELFEKQTVIDCLKSTLVLISDNYCNCSVLYNKPNHHNTVTGRIPDVWFSKPDKKASGYRSSGYRSSGFRTFGSLTERPDFEFVLNV